jgi:hypothetical protein
VHDLAFDEGGNVHVATNPVQTVVRLLGAGLGGREEKGKLEVETALGGTDLEETAGPTAAAFKDTGGLGEFVCDKHWEG